MKLALGFGLLIISLTTNVMALDFKSHFLSLVDELSPHLECPEGSKLVEESHKDDKLIMKYCVDKKQKRVGAEKKLLRTVGGVKVFSFFDNDRPQRKPIFAQYNNLGALKKLEADESVYNFKYDKDGNVVNVYHFNTKSKIATKESISPNDIPGCGKVEINESTQSIACQDGRVFVLNNKGINAAARELQKKVIEGQENAGSQTESKTAPK